MPSSTLVAFNVLFKADIITIAKSLDGDQKSKMAANITSKFLWYNNSFPWVLYH